MHQLATCSIASELRQAQPRLAHRGTGTPVIDEEEQSRRAFIISAGYSNVQMKNSMYNIYNTVRFPHVLSASKFGDQAQPRLAHRSTAPPVVDREGQGRRAEPLEEGAHQRREATGVPRAVLEGAARARGATSLSHELMRHPLLRGICMRLRRVRTFSVFCPVTT